MGSRKNNSGCYVPVQLIAARRQLVDILHKKARQQPGFDQLRFVILFVAFISKPYSCI